MTLLCIAEEGWGWGLMDWFFAIGMARKSGTQISFSDI